jgi:hypothetical protein
MRNPQGIYNVETLYPRPENTERALNLYNTLTESSCGEPPEITRIQGVYGSNCEVHRNIAALGKQKD